jgi:hypothetical protein
MTQSIALVTKFQPILDEVYKAASVTARLDSLVRPVSFAGANVVEVFKTSMAMGLADYNRLTGFLAGEVTGSWETLTLAKDRGREFSIDRMDDEETLGMAFGTLASEFIRRYVAPELDAYRFYKYAATGGNEEAAATYTSSTIVAAIDSAIAKLNADSVPTDGRILFISDSCYGFLKAAVTRMLGNENAVDRRVDSFDGMPVVMVPQTRFYQTVSLTAGSSATTGGFVGTYPMNFMIIHPSAVLQVAKHEQLKIFSPDVNQTMDAWKFQYRIYHDAFVYSEKVDGVAYSHQVGA